MKLLIVDDNTSVRRLIGRILSNRAHDIHECADGVDALAAYGAHLPDFVLMDISMKGWMGLPQPDRSKRPIPARW